MFIPCTSEVQEVGKNGWVEETERFVPGPDGSACWTSPQQCSSYKNSEACWEFFFFWIWENTKMKASKWEAWTYFHFHSVQWSGLPPPRPRQWAYVPPEGQNGSCPKHNKHYSVWVSFYISVFYFLFCLKWPVPQEYNLFHRFFFFFSFIFFYFLRCCQS